MGYSGSDFLVDNIVVHPFDASLRAVDNLVSDGNEHSWLLACCSQAAFSCR